MAIAYQSSIADYRNEKKLDRVERFETYCLFMFLLIAISLVLKSQIDRNHRTAILEHCAQLRHHEERIRELEFEALKRKGADNPTPEKES